MKKIIIIGFVFFFMAVAVQAEEPSFIYTPVAGVEDYYTIEGDLRKPPVAIVKMTTSSVLLVFQDRSTFRTVNRDNFGWVISMGSISLANSIPMALVYNRYGWLVGLKLQKF